MTRMLLIYGSGDSGSQELVRRCIERNILYKFKDIRVAEHGIYRNLEFLMERNLRTVPQVFDVAGNHIGGFDYAARVID